MTSVSARNRFSAALSARGLKLLVGLALVVVAVAAPAAGQTQQSAVRSRSSAGPAWPQLPFDAYLQSSFGFVRDKPSHASKLLALLRSGDTVVVQGCQPSCDAPRAWALLEPRGALPLHLLRTGQPSAAVQSQGSAAQYFYGRVPRPRTKVYAAPSVKAKVLHREKLEYRVAFVPNAQLAETGWLRRPDGGYMRKQDIKLFTPSVFVGAHDPTGAVAFVRRKVALRLAGERKPPKDPAQVVWMQRYDRFEVKGLRPGRVEIEGGWLPSALVRIAQPMQRPRGIAKTGKWMHVELGQQVLTAYEGDKMVFATLISAGKKITSTKAGRFEVYAKTVHSTMRGRPWDDYYAEEVPLVLHYDAGRALHGAYWHDQFGIPKSHGCINLSPPDAAWLFAWVPPEVPQGWHNVLPTSWGVGRVAVLVDRPGKRQTRPQVLAQEGDAVLQAVAAARPTGAMAGALARPRLDRGTTAR